MTKILIITQEIPYPQSTGGRQGVFHFIDKLRYEYEISILFPLFMESEKESLAKLKKIWDNVSFHVFEGTINTETKKGRLATLYDKMYSFPFVVKSKLSGKNKEINPNIDPVRDRSTLRTSFAIINWSGYIEFISEVVKNNFDIIQVEFYDFISLVHLLPDNVEKIFVHHEIRYVRNAIEMSFFKHVYPYDEYIFRISKQYELDSLKLYDKIITVTEADKEKLQRELPEMAIFASPLMVNLPDNVPDYEYKFNNKLTFVASPSHFPNLDGMHWFVAEIWPLLSKKYSSLELHLVGKGWSPEMFQGLNITNTFFDGYVEDLGDVLPNSISIVPIRIGSGMRMKILEAAHYKIPFVTTTVGVEGLDFLDGKDCYIEDKAEDFAKAVEKLIDSKDTQKQFVKESSETLHKIYNNESLISKRRFIYEAKNG
ncbi:glycosyltransferase [Dysgonomonas reticulitermitis]